MTINGNSSQRSLNEGSSLTESSRASPQGDQATVLKSPQALNDYVPPPHTVHSPHMSPAVSSSHPHQSTDTFLISSSTEASLQSFGAVASQATVANDPPPNYMGLSEEDEYNRQLQLEEQHALELQQNLYFQYEQQQQQQQQHQQQQLRAYPVPSPNSRASTIVQVTPTTSTAPYKNVTFIPCEPLENNDYSHGRYTFGTFLFNVRDYRKKESYIVLVLALAIVLGVLGGTVWNKNYSGDSGSKDHGGSSGVSSTGKPNSGTGSTSWPTIVYTGSASSAPPTSATFTSTSTASPAPSSLAPDPKPSPAPSTGGSGDFKCNTDCGHASSVCDSKCLSDDASLKSCLSTCSGDQRQVTNCTADCRFSNPCLNSCTSIWSSCVEACPP